MPCYSLDLEVVGIALIAGEEIVTKRIGGRIDASVDAFFHGLAELSLYFAWQSRMNPQSGA